MSKQPALITAIDEWEASSEVPSEEIVSRPDVIDKNLPPYQQSVLNPDDSSGHEYQPEAARLHYREQDASDQRVLTIENYLEDMKHLPSTLHKALRESLEDAGHTLNMEFSDILEFYLGKGCGELTKDELKKAISNVYRATLLGKKT